jgi:Zn-dependent protease with chaperone function
MDEQIRSNRRKIYWAITIYIWVTVLITAACGAWIVLTYDNLAGWLAFAGFFLLDFAMIRFATGSGMWVVRWVLRATTVYPGGAEEARDAVDDISIAIGMPAPDIMLIEEDFRNAISLKGRRGTAIIVTRGLLDDLDDDELRAVMAHEMVHLYNEDARLNTLIASLRGFSLVVRSLFGHLFGIFDSPYLGAVFEILVLPVLAVLPALAVLYFTGSSELERIILSAIIIVVLNLSFLVFFSRAVQRLVDPYREMRADELAVEWTKYPEGLVRALRKIEPRASVSRLGFLKGMFFGPVHTFGDLSRWQTDLQPTIDERIDNLERVLHTPLDPGREPPVDIFQP